MMRIGNLVTGLLHCIDTAEQSFQLLMALRDVFFQSFFQLLG